MNFHPSVSYALKSNAQLGSFCFVPGPEGAVVFGMLVEAARVGRKCDFLDLSSFRVLSGDLGFGIDSFYVVPDAVIKAEAPFSTTVQTCQSGQVPALGSIIFSSNGPAIVALSGRGPESIQVVIDVRSGAHLDRNFYNSIFCTRWQVVSANPDGLEQVLLNVQTQSPS